MNHFWELIAQIGQNPLQALLLILSVILIEVILSVDNAAVLATMVKDLPEKDQNKALSYGILGAYIFRGLALVFVSVIIGIWWLKPIGGLYLMWIAFKYFKDKRQESQSEDNEDVVKPKSKFQQLLATYIGTFWTTVIMVEFMDIVFSIDNIFAVVAMSSNMVLIVFGVFIGILAMRFVAKKFVKLMEKYPIMETSAFVVIGILGIKLFLALLVHFVPSLKWIESEAVDMVMSLLTLVIFFAPILWIRFSKDKNVHVGVVQNINVSDKDETQA